MPTYFYVRVDGRHLRIRFSDVIYLEARHNYTQVITAEKKLLILARMSRFEQFLTPVGFCRIHRSYMVHLDRIESFTREEVCLDINNIRLPVGERYRRQLEEKLIVVTCEGQPVMDLFA